MAAQGTSHWLDGYSNNAHPWQLVASEDGHKSFTRPLGVVETFFDTDGTYFGGRADMTATLTLRINHNLPSADLRGRIVLAWTLLRLRHVLLKARVEDNQVTGKRSFIVPIPRSTNDEIEDVSNNITFLSDHDFSASINALDLHYHALNVSRIIKPQTCLSKLHVLPLKPLPDGTSELRFLIIIAHQISDGLSAYNWFSHFIHILNTPVHIINDEIAASIAAGEMGKRLPAAQEDLYPKVAGNKARQRWFWAIIRVLRHVQRTMPRTFSNPLYRERRLEKAIVLLPTHSSIFDYSETGRPPISSGHVTATLSASTSQRLVKLCRGAGLSVGAGCFALAGLAMMRIHEARYPNSSEYPAFGASFPLNPRAFFTPQPEADSCMLAFSEGILMPFLPSSLPVEKRFLLVAKHANRELRVYQKRLRDGNRELGAFDKHSPARLLATGYLAQIERVDARLPEERRMGYSPQGELKPRVGKYGATCGVSSTGSVAAYFREGAYDLENMNGKDFVADYRSLKMGVRARDNEFLIGSSSNADGIIAFGVSYDENAISQEAAEGWARTIEGLLEEESVSKL